MHKEYPTVGTLVTIIVVFVILLLVTMWFAKQTRRSRAAMTMVKGVRGIDALSNGSLFGMSNNNYNNIRTPNNSYVATTPMGAAGATPLGAQGLNLQAYNLKQDSSESNSENAGNVLNTGNNGSHYVIRMYGQQVCDVSKNFEDAWKIVKNRLKSGKDGANLHFHRIICDGSRQNEQLKCSFAQINGDRLKYTPTVSIALRGEKNENLLTDESVSAERLEKMIRDYINNRNTLNRS